MLENSMQNRLGLHYTNPLIDCNHQTQGDNAVSRSTANLAFRIILPKILKNPENKTRNK